MIRIVLLAALTCIGPGARAQVERSGNEAQKFMQQYQQLAAERTALQTQVAGLKKDLDAAKTDLAGLTKERDALKSRVGGAEQAVLQAKTSKETTEQSLEQSKQRMNELLGRAREIALNLKEVELDRGKVRAELADRNRAYDACADHNWQLYEIDRELLDRYEHTGLFTRVLASEPFTRLTRTRIENLVDDYRARAEELRAKKPTSPDSGPN
jgi:chromosome segregation ATPase